MGLFEDFNRVSAADWRKKIEEDLKGKAYDETLVWKSSEGINIHPFYNKNEEICNVPVKSNNLWKIQERIIIDTIENANKLALEALKGGVNSLLFIGEIQNKEELEKLLKDIILDIVDIHIYSQNAAQISTFCNFENGSITYDYLGEYYKKGAWNSSKEQDLHELFELTTKGSVNQTINVNALLYDEKLTLTQQLAFSFCQAVEYLNVLTEKDLDAENVAKKIQFNFPVGANYFFEISKIRAARLLWKLILDAFQINDDIELIINSTTNITQNNAYSMIGNTTQAMSAIIGGCNNLTVLPHNTENSEQHFANRVARNVQHILKEESFFDKVTNPTDGAYYIEHLTNELAKTSWKLFQEMEKNGGYLACIESNYFQKNTTTHA